MPLGVKNAPSVFQCALIKALGSEAHIFVIPYIDDVLIVAETKEKAMERLDPVLQILKDANVSFNIKKLTLLTQKIVMKRERFDQTVAK